MTEEKKLSRRDAIKLIGATAGASVLTQLPSKWSKPSLAGGVLPPHAQTSGCGPGFSSMLVEFLEVRGNNIESGYGANDIDYQHNAIQTTGVATKTGYTIFFPCFDGCAGFGFGMDDTTTATVKVTFNGVVEAYWVDVTATNHSLNFDGSAGEIGVGSRCRGPRFTEKYWNN